MRALEPILKGLGLGFTEGEEDRLRRYVNQLLLVTSADYLLELR